MPVPASPRIRWPSALLLAVVLAGCAEDPNGCPLPVEVPAGPLADEGADFNPSTAGTLEGRVTWGGVVPTVPPFRSPVSPLSEQALGPPRFWANPHAPVVDSHSRGVAGAVVFLRGVDPRCARPWDHPPVRVELRDYQIHVLQGEADSRTGFVRRGATVMMLSAQSAFHSLQARGAAFFALAFPDPGRPCTRRLEQPGVVELSSGAGYFWMRAHLFVDDHPYYTRTDRRGCFRLPQVPPGNYQVVCWLPDWREASHELDADTGEVCRLAFRPPREWRQDVRLEAGQTRAVSFQLSAATRDR